MTREPAFLKSSHRKNIPGQTNQYWFTFLVPIGTTKKTIQFQFHTDSPTLAYKQHDQNYCCFFMLDYSFVLLKELVSENAIATCIPESTSYKVHEYSDTYKVHEYSDTIKF